MKKYFYILASILLNLLSFQSKADHLVGSDISYQCTSTPGVYKVILKVYRDCAGAYMCPGCANTPGSVSSCTTANACCGFSNTIIGKDSIYNGVNYGSYTLTAVSTTSGYDIVQTCNSVTTICSNCNTRTAGTFNPGIEVYTFEGNVNLSSIPTLCCRVAIGFSVCCRNLASTTISSFNYYSEAIVNRCQAPCNSAPTFTNDAVVLVCSGVDFVYNLGAIDPDGDSLSYTFGESLQSFNTPVAYKSPYSASYPFAYFGAPNTNATYPGGLRIDPLTGDIKFRPIGQYVSNLVIEVTQWKLVGSVRVNVGMTRRDVQFQTNFCLSNKAPIIKAYKSGVLQTGLSYAVCAGQQICLDLVAQDQQDLTVSPAILADTTDLKWNNPGLYNSTMANATFTRNYILSTRNINGPKADSFKFCWTPPSNAARSLPHLFTVTASDRLCPIKAVNTFGLNITVVARPIPFITVVNNFCSYRTFNFTLSNSNQTTLDSTKCKWQIETSPGSGTYTLANASPGFSNIAYRQYFSAAGTYKWRLALNSQLPVPVGCPSLDSGTIINGEPFKVNVRDTFNCFGSPVTIKAIASGGNRVGNQAGFQFFLGGLSSQTVIKGNLDPTSGFGITIDSFLTVTPSNIGDTTMYKVKIKDATGCLDSTTFKILTRASPLRELTPKIRLCEGSDTSMFAGTNGSIPIIKTYWYKAPNLTMPIDTQRTLTFTQLKNADSATIVLSKTDIYGCNVFDTTKLYVNKPVSFISPKDSACTNNQIFALTARLNTMFIDSFVWYNIGTTNKLLINNSLLLPTSTIGTSFYKLRGYQTYDGISCFKDDTASLKIKGIPIVNLTNNRDSFCQGLVSVLKVTPNTSGHSFKWLKNNQIIASETKDSLFVNDAFAYRAIVSFGGCADTSITKNLTIYPKPIIGFSINNATQCLANNVFNFTNTSAISSGSANYKWVLGQNDTSNVPNKSFTQIGNYRIQLIGLSDKNCKDTLSKSVSVNASAISKFTINNASQCLTGNNFVFTNSSTSSNSQNWNFGDASNSTVLNPTKTFTNAGSYSVKLKANNTNNCPDSITKTVNVNAQPTIGTITGNVAPNSISTPFTYSVLSQSNITYNWATTNGTIQSGQGTNTVNIVWPTTGTGNLKVKITNNNSCSDSTNLLVNITSVGINNLSLDNDLKVYPNPTKTSITITNKNNLIGKKYIISNLIGQTLLSGKLNLDETIVNLEILQTGVYLLSIDGLNKQSIKVIKE